MWVLEIERESSLLKEQGIEEDDGEKKLPLPIRRGPQGRIEYRKFEKKNSSLNLKINNIN